MDQVKRWVYQTETPRSSSFCHFTIQGNRVFMVEDALTNPLFNTNPLVLQAPNVRFYAGAPLIVGDRFGIGGFCLLDTAPRKLTKDHEQQLQNFAALTSHTIAEMYQGSQSQPRPASQLGRYSAP